LSSDAQEETRMDNPPRHPRSEQDTGRSPNWGTDRRPPRWVFVLGIIVAVALLGLMVLLHLGGTLGPGVH